MQLDAAKPLVNTMFTYIMFIESKTFCFFNPILLFSTHLGSANFDFMSYTVYTKDLNS